MLQLILGRAGSGKTTLLVEKINAAVASGKKAIFLVPEQYSFEAERLVYQSLGAKGALEVEVLSFTRLASNIFRKFGGLSGVSISDTGKYMLMSLALSELGDEIRVYKKSAANTAFLQTLTTTCSELKTSGITPDALEEISHSCEEGLLKDKLDELGVIYATYQALIERGYNDPDDDLLRAIKALKENDGFFDGVSVFVDGFTTFMAAEFEMLYQIIASVNEVAFALCADQMFDNQKELGLFSPTKTAISRLDSAAKRAGVSVLSPIILHKPLKYQSPALAHLSVNFLQPSPEKFIADLNDAITIYPAQDIYRECEYVAAKIAALVRDSGYRYNEIAVVARDLKPYLRAVEEMFSRFNITYFWDMRDSAENSPLFAGLAGALQAAQGFDTQAVLGFAKSPISGCSREDVAELENYCFVWRIKGSLWLGQFKNNPRGLAQELTEADREKLDRINSVRKVIVEPLLILKESMKKATGISFASGIFSFLEKIDAGENLVKFAEGLDANSARVFLDESAQLWDCLIEILDVFGAVIGKMPITAKRAVELFSLAATGTEVAQIPQTLDQVLLGHADRVRPGRIKAVFLIGANEGVFPPQISPNGLFTDAEREEMIKLGAEISPPILKQTIIERYYGYFAATIASEKLFVSYPQSDMRGGKLSHSVIVSSIKAIFPTLKPTEDTDGLLFLNNRKTALELFAKNIGDNSELASSLKAYLEAGDDGQAALKLEEVQREKAHMIKDSNLAKALFGDNFRLSPSKVERYYNCPFSYYASDGIKLNVRKRAEFSPIESGSIIHHVLNVILSRHGGKGLSNLTKSQLKTEIKETINDYLTGRIEEMDALPARFHYLFGRLAEMMLKLIRRLAKEFAQSDFQPVAFELPINLNQGIPPLKLYTPDGGLVTVEGVVDRVDIAKKGSQRYLRVVDYKSGAKQFKLQDVLYGLNMQMLFYLFTLEQNGVGELADAVAAGVLYMPIRESYVAAQRNEDADNLLKEQEKQWKMSGLLLDDKDVITAMEREVAGAFIPAKLSKDGSFDPTSSLATSAQMGRLAKKVKQQIVDMAIMLREGEVDSIPIFSAASSDYNVCGFCDFSSLCGFEEGDTVREIAKIKPKEFFEILGQEEQDG